MRYEQKIDLLESEWAPDEGFFWRIRQGLFVPVEFERALKKVSTISIAEDAELPRRLVSLLWYIPIFMQWQAERVRENDGDTVAYSAAVIAMTNEVERLLGVP